MSWVHQSSVMEIDLEQELAISNIYSQHDPSFDHEEVVATSSLRQREKTRPASIRRLPSTESVRERIVVLNPVGTREVRGSLYIPTQLLRT